MTRFEIAIECVKHMVKVYLQDRDDFTYAYAIINDSLDEVINAHKEELDIQKSDIMAMHKILMDMLSKPKFDGEKFREINGLNKNGET